MSLRKQYDVNAALEEFGEQLGIGADEVELVNKASEPEEVEPISNDEPEVVEAKEPEQQQEEVKPRYVEEANLAVLEAQLNTFREQIADQIGSLSKGLTPTQQPAQQPTTEYEQFTADPEYAAHPLVKEVESLKQQLASVEELKQSFAKAQRETSIMSERTKLQSAVSQLREKYPDLHEFVKESNIAATFEKCVEVNAFGQVDWQSEIDKTYKTLSFDTKVTAAKKAADELAAKREEKKAKGAAAASAVPPGGGSFQAPKVQSRPFERGYKSASAAMLAELEGLG